MLRNTVESLGGVRKSDDYKPHGTPLGELLFPGSKNPTGIVMDTLARRAR